MITWEGRSCSDFHYGNGASVIIYGIKGALVHSGNTCCAFDLEGNKMWESGEKASKEKETTLRGMSSSTTLPFKNFINAIREGVELYAPIDISYKSNLLAHLGNYAQETGGYAPY